MTFSSRASLPPHHFPVTPEKISQIGKPVLVKLNSTAPTDKKLSIASDNKLVAHSLKHMAFSFTASTSSYGPATSKKLHPTIVPLNSLPPSRNENNNHDNAMVSSPIKDATYPSELHICTVANDCNKHARNLKVFKQILIEVGEDPFEGLAMIDALQRLGIDYHFQAEIEEILQRHYIKITNRYSCGHYHDLQEVALCFRLLRQEGYNVPAEVFNDFVREKEGKSHWDISHIKGLMELYEASQLTVKGEDLMDEVGNLSASLLKEWVTQVGDDQAKVVWNTLSYPHHKSLPRFMAKSLPRFMAKTMFHSNYQGESKWIHDLQELAIMDFNIVQSLHQKEIIQVSKWWKDLGLAKELKFARDQPIKWYIWSMACLTDPEMSQQRVELTKPISLVYIIDDIFDVYGSLDELTLFTETITRWDLSAADMLPQYMRICFKALNDITNEISYKVYDKHGYDPVHSLQKAWANLCNAFLVEAKWFDSGAMPTAEEYLKNGIVSSGVHVGLLHFFFLLGHNLSRKNVELIDNHPSLISSTATILRLWDDLGSAKDENQEGKDGSYIHYYMMENQDKTADFAKKQALHKISDAWKSLNKECLSSNPFSKAFKRACLNVARMVPMMYNYDDNQRLPVLEDYIKSLLFENTPTRGLY